MADPKFHEKATEPEHTNWMNYKNNDDLRRKMTEVLRAAEMEIPPDSNEEEAMPIIQDYFKKAGYPHPISSCSVGEADQEGKRVISAATQSHLSGTTITFLN